MALGGPCWAKWRWAVERLMPARLRQFLGIALYHAVKRRVHPSSRSSVLWSFVKDGLIIEVCLLARADPNAIGDPPTGMFGSSPTEGRNTLHKAACNVYVADQLIKRLLASGANPNARDWAGETALHIMLSNSGAGGLPGHINSLKYLLAAGADPNARDASGETPLHRVRNGYDVGLLVAAGADPNLMSLSGNTPLHEAARRRSSMVVRALLLANADPCAQNNDGDTPERLAAQAVPGRTAGNVVAMLRDAEGSRNEKERARESALRSGKVVPLKPRESAAAGPKPEHKEKLERD